MTLKDTLDQFTKVIRALQYRDYPKEELVALLQNLIILVGQVLAQRDNATEKLRRYDKQLWLSHIMGQVDCLDCSCQFFLFQW